MTMTTPAPSTPAPDSPVPDGVLLFRHPDHPEVFAVYPSGLVRHVQWSLWHAWGSPVESVHLLNKDNGSADSDYQQYLAYDKALRAS
jgi:hypothetical protein